MKLGLDLRQSDPRTPSWIRAALCVLQDFRVAEREPDLGWHSSSATISAIIFLDFMSSVRDEDIYLEGCWED